MRTFLLVLFVSIGLTASSQTYYIVRHAEKAVPSAGSIMSTPDDPPLSEAGQLRALALVEELKGKEIKKIYSTNTIRTKSTAGTLSKETAVDIETYGPFPDSTFIAKLKALGHNALIVGHSNTVDDIVNGLLGEKKLEDLTDSEYSHLFIVTIKDNKGIFEDRKYGK